MNPARRSLSTRPTPLEVAIALIAPRQDVVHRDHRRGKGDHYEIELAGRYVPVWVSGRGPTVLLVHGWESTHADLAKVAEALNDAGLRTVSFDHPAHGAAPGQVGHLPLMIEATITVAKAFGPLHAVVGHSAGAAAAALALSREPIAERAVLIAPPARYRDIVVAAAQSSGLGASRVGEVVAHLQDFGVDPAHLDVPAAVASLGQVPALVLQSANDRVVAVADGREVSSAWPGALFAELQGLGHRRILVADDALELITGFLAPASWLGEVPSRAQFPMLHFM